MPHRILFVAQVGPPDFPRFSIYDTDGRLWDGEAWVTASYPLLYADQHSVSNDCAEMQRQETVGKQCCAVIEVPIRAEIFSNQPLDPDELRNWLYQHISLNIDISSGSGPTVDSIVLGAIDWPRYRIQAESS